MPSEWLATNSVPPELLKAALNADGESVDSPPHLHPQRSHYEMTISYTVLGRGHSQYIPLDGTHISSKHPTRFPRHYLPLIRRRHRRPHQPKLPRHLHRPPHPPHDNASPTLRDRNRSCTLLYRRRVPAPGFPPLSSSSTDEELDARIREHAVTLYHFGGSAAMG
jgi:hypothetical protein